MQNVRWGGAASAILAVLFQAAPQNAHACSCVGHVELRTTLAQPDGGVMDVPRDVAPILTGYFDTDSVEWTTEAGIAVPFTSRVGVQFRGCAGSLMELVPMLPLAAATTYVVRVRANGRATAGEFEEFRFTTGASESPERELPAPSLTATIVSGRAVYDSCVSEVHGCIALGEHETEVTFLDEHGAVLNWTIASGETVMERGAWPGTACIEARTRDGSGRRSAPLRRCGSELGQRAALRSDYDDYRLRCRGGRILPDADASLAPMQRNDAGADESSARENVADAAAPSTTATGSASAESSAVETNEASEPASTEGCSARGDAPSLSYGTLAAIACMSLLSRKRRARRV